VIKSITRIYNSLKIVFNSILHNKLLCQTDSIFEFIAQLIREKPKTKRKE